mmetsp:Transcript_7004/g.13076  ORF Transcript_7004/g.13076 Transcript_7004/m.13076 type:complete len:93 (-) Transcript_7004:122-400(-)
MNIGNRGIFVAFPANGPSMAGESRVNNAARRNSAYWVAVSPDISDSPYLSSAPSYTSFFSDDPVPQHLVERKPYKFAWKLAMSWRQAARILL